MRFLITLAIVVLSGLFAPLRAQEVEMELKVANGTTVREFHISDFQGTMMQCVFQAPVIASRWIQENLGEGWVVIRMTCGPPHQSL